MSKTQVSEALPEADSSHPQSTQHQLREHQQQQQQQKKARLDGDMGFKASPSISFSDCNNNNNNSSTQRPSSSASSSSASSSATSSSSSSSSSSVYDDRVKASQSMINATMQKQQQELQQSDSPFYMELRKKQNRNAPSEERRRPTRPLVQQMSRPLKRWLRRHRQTPYPTIADKRDLARQANMTVTQVSNWFANARRRLKNTVRDPTLSWSMRIKAYNRLAAGKQEMMSSDSSSSEEEDDDDEEEEEEERTGRIPSPEGCCCCFRSQDSGQENDDGALPNRNLHHVRCPASTADTDHKLSSLSDCMECDVDDDDEPDCIRDRRRVRCPGNLAEDETRRDAAPLNLDDVAAHQIRLRRIKTKEWEAATPNHRTELIEMCSKKQRKKMRRLHPTNIKTTRNLLPHGPEEELEEAGKMELWTLEDIYSEMLRNRENSSKTNSSTEDLYWMEIGAAITLTRMSRSCRQNNPSPSTSSSSSSSPSFGSVGMPRKWNLDIV